MSTFFMLVCMPVLPVLFCSPSQAINGIWYLSMTSTYLEKEFSTRVDRKKCGRIRDREAVLLWVTDELCSRKFLALLPKNHIIWTWEEETKKQRGQPDIIRAMESPVISDGNDGDYHRGWVCMTVGCGKSLGVCVGVVYLMMCVC